MKKTIKSFLLVLALMASANTAYATNSFVTPNGDGTYTGTIYGTISAQLDSWMELDKGNGYQQYNRSVKPTGEITAQVPGLACGRSYPYRTAAAYNGSNLYGQVFNLQVNCANTGGGTGGSVISVTTDNASPNQFAATLYSNVSGSADSWIEVNTGLNGANNVVQIGRATHSGSYNGYVSGLQCNSRYNYRAVAQGPNGLVYGSARSFDTSACNNNGGGTNNATIRTITTTATGVGYTSARLNGLSIISTTPTQGYFQYGTTQNLGNTTTSKTYFESNSVPLVDVITGLSQGTTYYYRAVAQNANGIAYGDIMSFRTDVLPTTTTTNTGTNTTNTITRVVNTVTRAVTGTTNTNSGVVYIPVQLANVGTVAGGVGATAIPSLATVSVVKSGADGCNNTFTITYTNTSDKTLSNVLISTALPNELEFVSASEGSFRSTDNTLTVAVGTLEARASRTVTITTKVLGGAQTGKTVAVTSYLNYTDGASSAQDQVTGYTLLTIDEGCVTTVVGTSQAGAAGLSGILPNSIWQWLAVIIAIILIVVAGRSLFASSASKSAH